MEFIIFFNTDFSKNVEFIPLSENELIEVNERNAIARLYFGSKANSLINVEKSLKKLEIPKFIVLYEKDINKKIFKANFVVTRLNLSEKSRLIFVPTVWGHGGL